MCNNYKLLQSQINNYLEDIITSVSIDSKYRFKQIVI